MKHLYIHKVVLDETFFLDIGLFEYFYEENIIFFIFTFYWIILDGDPPNEGWLGGGATDGKTGNYYYKKKMEKVQPFMKNEMLAEKS